MVSDDDLTNQLYNFMLSIPMLWKLEVLEAMHQTNESHKEYRGPEDGSLIFAFDVVENEIEYLQVLLSVSDVSRGIKVYGSSYRPLGTSFIWFKDGKLDMPSEKEIYKNFKML